MRTFDHTKTNRRNNEDKRINIIVVKPINHRVNLFWKSVLQNVYTGGQDRAT